MTKPEKFIPRPIIANPIRTAILVDGGFYRRRAQAMLGEKTAEERANELSNYCYKHINSKHEPGRVLYRIFYYDCLPVERLAYQCGLLDCCSASAALVIRKLLCCYPGTFGKLIQAHTGIGSCFPHEC